MFCEIVLPLIIRHLVCVFPRYHRWQQQCQWMKEEERKVAASQMIYEHEIRICSKLSPLTNLLLWLFGGASILFLYYSCNQVISFFRSRLGSVSVNHQTEIYWTTICSFALIKWLSAVKVNRATGGTMVNARNMQRRFSIRQELQ